MPRKMTITYTKDEEEFDDFFDREAIGFRTRNIDLITSIFSFVQAISDSTNIRMEKDGIYICVMDPTHISLLDCYIPKHVFSTYNISETCVRGLNLTLVNKVLAQVKSTDELIITFEEDNMTVTVLNSNHEKFYEIKLIDYDDEEMNVEDEEDISIITFDARYFTDLVKDLSAIGETLRVKILAEKKKISMKSSGEMTDLKIVLKEGDIKYENLQDTSQEYSLKHFMTFIKSSGLSSKTEMRIKENAPLRLSHYFMKYGYLRYYLAPKIEDD